MTRAGLLEAATTAESSTAAARKHRTSPSARIGAPAEGASRSRTPIAAHVAARLPMAVAAAGSRAMNPTVEATACSGTATRRTAPATR